MNYDAFDNVQSVLDDNNISSEALYDEIDRITKITTHPETAVNVETIFNYEDRVLKSIELPQNFNSPGTRFTNLEYDPLGRVKNVLRDVNSTSQEVRVGFDYDGFGQVRALKRLTSDGYSFKSHRVEYDRLGRSVKTTDFRERESFASHEQYCTGQAVDTARGVRRTTSFDTLCRLTQVRAGDADPDPEKPFEIPNPTEVRNFEYDDLGRLIKASQSRGFHPTLYGQAIYGVSTYGRTANEALVREYKFDSLDRLTKVTFEDDKVMDLEYDYEGNLTRITEDASSGTPVITDYTYFGDNLLQTVTFRRASGDKTFTYAYDPGGRLASIQYPASTGITAYFDDGAGGPGWDGHGQLRHLRYVKGGSNLQSFEYTYDKAGNRRSQKDVPATGDSKLWVYEYDYLDRLYKVSLHTHADPAQLSEASAVTQSIYGYDGADNRVELNLASINEILTFGYNVGDEITSLYRDTGSGPALVETFTFDNDGNMTTRTNASSGVVTTYNWTDFNRLASIETTDNSKSQSHDFWVNGFRRKKTDKNAVETTEYAPGLATAVAKSQASTVTYLMGHHLLGMETGGSMFFYLADGLATNRHVIDVNGTIKASYEFSEHGERIATYENGVSSQKTYVGGLSVQDEVGETGLMMMGHRFYEPSLGRFLNRDPIGFAGGLNLFSYGANNPVTYTDHTGLQPGSGEKHAVFVGDYPSDPSAWVIVEGPWKPRDYGPPTANDIVLLSEWDERNLGNLADSLGIDRDKMVVGGAIATMIAIALSLRKGGPGLVPSDTIFKGAKASPCVNKTFNRHGSMTTGKYTISRPGMTRHTNGIPGPEGKSQFFFRIEADSLVLDAAHYADLMRLWERNKAKIPLNDFIGVTGGGKPTTVLNIYRDLKGRVHGAPGN